MNNKEGVASAVRELLRSLGRPLQRGESKELARDFRVSRQRIHQLAKELGVAPGQTKRNYPFCPDCGKQLTHYKPGRCQACAHVASQIAPRITRLCATCGKPITRPAYLAGRPRYSGAFYCDRQCFIGRREDIIVTCPTCQTTFIARFKESRKYCSRKCAWQGRTKARHDTLS